MVKICFKCGQNKPLSEFYTHSQMADGHLNKCKVCTRRDTLANRAAKAGYYRAYDRARAPQPHRVAARRAYARTERGRLAHDRATKKYVVSNPVKKRARVAVGNAVRDGRLIPLPCLICGGKAEDHHADYDNPLGVTWLCSVHHKAAHALTRKAA